MVEQTLAGIELFKGLPAPERSTVERRCAWRKFAAGEQIIDRATDTHEVYFIVAGRVRVVNFSASGREISFAEIGAGGYFGELAAIDGRKRSANVVAVSETLTASLSQGAFLDMIAQHPFVALALLRRMAHVIRQSTGRIMALSTEDTHHRIFAELLRLADADRATANRALIKPLPTHAEIAARVSTTRETVARTIAELAADNLVKRERGALAIIDIAGLRRRLATDEE